jgi:hypothetical protein
VGHAHLLRVHGADRARTVHGERDPVHHRERRVPGRRAVL